MRRMVLVAFPLLLSPQGASAATAIGSNALALAAFVAENSPLLGADEKMVMARLIDGNLNFAFPKVKPPEGQLVAADKSREARPCHAARRLLPSSPIPRERADSAHRHVFG